MEKSACSISSAALLALLAGCATPPLPPNLADSPAVTVNIPSAGDAKWIMRVTQAPTNISVRLSLEINGTPVGTGEWFPRPANIKGTYAGHAVQALCQVTGAENPQSRVQTVAAGTCVVYVDGTQVATLLF